MSATTPWEKTSAYLFYVELNVSLPGCGDTPTINRFELTDEGSFEVLHLIVKEGGASNTDTNIIIRTSGGSNAIYYLIENYKPNTNSNNNKLKKFDFSNSEWNNLSWNIDTSWMGRLDRDKNLILVPDSGNKLLLIKRNGGNNECV